MPGNKLQDLSECSVTPRCCSLFVWWQLSFGTESRPSPQMSMTERIIQNQMSTRGTFWRVRGWGSQKQNRKAEFGQVQKVYTVAKVENIRSYEALESSQDIEEGKEEVERD